MMFQLEELMRIANSSVTFLNGRFVPARPLPGSFWHGSFKYGRLRAAWAVLRGTADAVIWPEDDSSLNGAEK